LKGIHPGFQRAVVPEKLSRVTDARTVAHGSIGLVVGFVQAGEEVWVEASQEPRIGCTFPYVVNGSILGFVLVNRTARRGEES
jgi:hypothetical protein